MLLLAVTASALAFGIPPVGKYDSVRTAPFHPSIHNLGNTGFWGEAHAQGAWCATRLIDRLAYGGQNMRGDLALGMASLTDARSSLLEIGCGVGTLTHELEKTDVFDITAVDTSREMLDVAARYVHNTNTTLLQSNGVDVQGLFDVVVICMVMHELPRPAHRDMLKAMARLARREVWVVDIDPAYEPSLTMLSGEPYVPTYLSSIERTINRLGHALHMDVHTFDIVTGHVRGWVLEK